MLGGDLRCEKLISILVHRLTTWCLSVHLERMGNFAEDAVRIYIAELGSALAFLHEKKIIHR